MEELSSHPTVKPVAMVMDAIKDCSKPKGLILDAFGGSGTTLIAAAKTKRRGYLLELDPLYVDVIVRRWEKFSKREARHAETGLTFREMTEQRTATGAGSDVLPQGAVGHVRKDEPGPAGHFRRRLHAPAAAYPLQKRPERQSKRQEEAEVSEPGERPRGRSLPVADHDPPRQAGHGD